MEDGAKRPSYPGLNDAQEAEAVEMFKQVFEANPKEAAVAHKAFANRGVWLGDLPFMTTATFSGWADESKPFKGYDSGERWNGWACPLLPLSEVERLVAEQATLKAEHPDQTDGLRLDPNEEGEYPTLVFVSYYDESESQINPRAEQTEDGEVFLYDVGFAWTWSVEEDDEEEELVA
jgi:hypothetical protein